MKQPEAFRLADIIGGTCADELRRLHDVNQELVFALQNLLDVKDGKGGTKYPSDGIARAAIAKATGGQS